MNPSIKRRIIRELVRKGEVLQASGALRKFRRGNGLLLLEKVTPSGLLVIGPEQAGEQDNEGYQIEFPIFLKLTLSKSDKGVAADPYDAADAIEQAVMEKFEDDSQLANLAVDFRYDESVPFTQDEEGTIGGTILTYIVTYRRPRKTTTERY